MGACAGCKLIFVALILACLSRDIRVSAGGKKIIIWSVDSAPKIQERDEVCVRGSRVREKMGLGNVYIYPALLLAL